MGLIKAALGAAGGTLADQWKEFFYCDAIDNDVLAVKGQKRTSKRSSNTKGSDNIITTGSGIAVARSLISARNQANTPTMLLPSQVFSPEIWATPS